MSQQKNVVETAKRIVFGYLRQSQQALPHQQNSFYIIPDLVALEILMFHSSLCPINAVQLFQVLFLV